MLYVPVRYKIDKVQIKKANVIAEASSSQSSFPLYFVWFPIQFIWTVRSRKHDSVTSSFVQVNGGIDELLGHNLL